MKRGFLHTPPIYDDTPKKGMTAHAGWMTELKVDVFGDFSRG